MLRKGGDTWKGKGEMGMSYGEIVKVAKETSGCTRGGIRFREKRQRIGEGPAAIEV